MKSLTSCRNVIAWGTDQREIEQFRQAMEPLGFVVETTLDAQKVAASANLIVTATPSTLPLPGAEWIHSGTHITAVGADTPQKQELDTTVFSKTDVVVADSIVQCRDRGEIHHALQEGKISESDLIELGEILANKKEGRTSDDQIPIADLTWVAVQNIQISKAVFERAAGLVRAT